MLANVRYKRCWIIDGLESPPLLNFPSLSGEIIKLFGFLFYDLIAETPPTTTRVRSRKCFKIATLFLSIFSMADCWLLSKYELLLPDLISTFLGNMSWAPIKSESREKHWKSIDSNEFGRTMMFSSKLAVFAICEEVKWLIIVSIRSLLNLSNSMTHSSHTWRIQNSRTHATICIVLRSPRREV